MNTDTSRVKVESARDALRSCGFSHRDTFHSTNAPGAVLVEEWASPGRVVWLKIFAHLDCCCFVSGQLLSSIDEDVFEALDSLAVGC